MPIRVLFFAGAAQLAGQAEVEWEWSRDLTVLDLRQRIAGQWPTMERLLPACRLAVNEAYAGDNDPVPEAAVVAVIPPVSGG